MGREKYKKYYQGGYYHIYNRGVNRQKIFLDDQDRIQYLKRLKEYKPYYQVSMLCYCLMPNHIHLVVRQNTEKPIYKFIQSLHTSYGMYFNKKYERVGSLWQGRFNQTNIEDDSYLIYVSIYIHLNPLVDKLVDKISDYTWSSCLDYMGLREGVLCEKEIILQGQSLFEYRRLLEQYKDSIKERKEIKHVFKDCP